MADFELEQLKTLFESMSQRLDETSGDLGNRKELEQIKKAIQNLSTHITKATSGSQSATENRQFISDFFREWDRQNPLKEVREAVDELNKDLNKNPLRSGSGGGGSGGGSGGDGDGGEGFFDKVDKKSGASKAFGKLGGAATALTGAFTAMAGVVGASYGWLKEQGDAYRRILATAEGDAGSIMQMRQTAATNDMSVEELVSAMESSSAFRSMGSAGFAQMSKAFRDNTLALGNLGLNFEQQLEAFDAYAELTRSQGLLGVRTPEEMAAGMERLVGVNQEIASILGLTRKEALEAAKEASMDPLYQSMLQQMQLTDAQRTESALVMKNLENVAPEFASYIKDIIGTQGALRTLESQRKFQMDPAAQAVYRETMANRNNLTAEKLIELSQMYREGARQSSKDRNMQQAMTVQVFTGRSEYGSVLGMQNEGRRMNELKDDLSDRESRAAAGPMDNAILGVEEAERRIAAAADNVFNRILIPAFDEFGTTAQSMVTSVNELAASMHHFAENTMAKNPNASLMGGLGIGGIGTLLTVAGGAGASLLGGSLLGKMFGRGGGAAGGAAGAGGGGIGSTLAKGAGFAARGLGALGGAYGVYDGTSRAASSTDAAGNAIGYGEAALGGAAIGATLGSAFFGIGAVPGALIGGALGGGGAMLYDWFDDSDNTASAQSKKATTPKLQTSARPAPADATGKATTPETQLVRINTKILEYQTESLKQLAAIKVHTRESREALVEQLTETRAQTEKLARLLEEGNRNTREIRGLA